MSLAAATPDNAELQDELYALLAQENAEIEAANWVAPNTVIVEAILAHCREAKMRSVYIGALAEMATKILEDAVRVEAWIQVTSVEGSRIWGFAEPRDARGVKLRLTNRFA